VTFNRDEAIQRIADDVTELVDSRTHTEPYRTVDSRTRKVRWMAHRTAQPSLLDQLRRQVGRAGASEGEGGSGKPGSRSPLNEDALDRLMAVEAASAWWTSVRLRRDLRETVEENLRLLVGASTRMDDHELRDLAADIRRWHTWVATLTGWRSPPWRPHIPCPLCARMGTLRVKLDEKRATCLGCGEAWDEYTIGLLADHIRETGLAADTPEVAS
jgi:hypothetical protein